ncbi:MAG: hypothetical protein MN733_34730 [Nitrososphaera sp.]|nr:hypothetical protein [Nitrososphaera sp.]
MVIQNDMILNIDDAIDRNLAALEHHLKLCREHGTYVDIDTLAFAIHHILGDDTEVLARHLSAYAKGVVK